MASNEVTISRKAKFDFAWNANQYLNPYRLGSPEHAAYAFGWEEVEKDAKDRRRSPSDLGEGRADR